MSAPLPPKPRTIEGLKRQAWNLKKENGCQYAKALEMVSRIHGWKTYAAAKHELGGAA